MRKENTLPMPSVDWKPAIFAVETVLGCDLKCPECAIGGDYVHRKKGAMPFQRFKVIADKIRPYCKHLYLHIWGEPMLNPDIFEMIEYAAQFTRTNISTNGKQLTSRKAEKLITSGVSEIIVSIDGVTQDIYEQYRAGGDVEKAMNALTMLQAYNQRHGGNVHIIPQFIVMRHNQHEMDQFNRVCKSMALQPTFKAPYIRDPDSKFEPSDHSQYHRPVYAGVAQLKRAMSDCSSVRRDFNILLDGTVVLCCHDYDGFTNFGNIFRQDVMDIWNGDDYRQTRLDTISGNPSRFCMEKCMSYFLDPKQVPETANITARETQPLKINLCCGPIKLDGYVNIDQCPGVDVVLDLEKDLLPFADNSADVVACISAINYFERDRALKILKDTHRILKPGGVARFASQDLRVLTEKYLKNDADFYFQKLPDGSDRFPGITIGDKLNAFFYGFYSGQKHCKYVYDFESLRQLFLEAGFSDIIQKNYRESLIPEVARLDNRPEQMFFLEAIKEGTAEIIDLGSARSTCKNRSGTCTGSLTSDDAAIMASAKQDAMELWDSGEKERAWQCFLELLDQNPDDREIVLKCIGILDEAGRFADMARLCASYLKCRPEDTRVQNFYRRAKQQEKQNQVDDQTLAQRRADIIEHATASATIHPDEHHLEACMQWLASAQDAHRGGGVSAVYHMDTRQWDVDYPETTGYIIPTFLSYYRLCGDEGFLERAVAAGDWEISIQAAGGGAGEPVGVYGLKPRIFNTGQVILGWLALYEETGHPRYLEAAVKAADWIVANQDDDGKWTQSTYRGPKSYHSRVTWALSQLYGIVGGDHYRNAIVNSINWVLSNVNGTGWFAANSLSEPGKPWTHLTGYVLVGLMKICQLTEDNPDFNSVVKLLHIAAKEICGSFADIRTADWCANMAMLPATFDASWSSSDQWSCVTGNAQTSYFLRGMYSRTNDIELKIAADDLADGLKQVQFIGDCTDRHIYGGLPGSIPIQAPYLSYAIPNWGVKFFADCLIDRISPSNVSRAYLG